MNGPKADDIRRPPPEGTSQVAKQHWLVNGPKADDIRRPPPRGQAKWPSNLCL